MPNRYPDRKRIVRDDEDGPVSSSSHQQAQHAQKIQHGHMLAGNVNGNKMMLQQPGAVNARATPQQKPFYFGMNF